jgi:cobalt-zinc-cadmium resistance protein CzcA
MLIFDDDSTSDINREHVLERLSQVSLPANLVPQMGTDWSPVGQIYWYTLESTNPAYDVMEKKSLEDWTLESRSRASGRGGCVQLRRADQGIPDQARSGEAGRLRPFHRPGGAADRQQQHQWRRQLYRRGHAADQRTVRWASTRSVQDIENTVVKTANGTAIKIKDIATVARAKIRLGQIGRATHRPTERSSIIPTPSKALCCCKRATTPIRFCKASTVR